MCVLLRNLRSSAFSDWIFLVEMENKNKFLAGIVALNYDKKQEKNFLGKKEF